MAKRNVKGSFLFLVVALLLLSAIFTSSLSALSLPQAGSVDAEAVFVVDWQRGIALPSSDTNDTRPVSRAGSGTNTTDQYKALKVYVGGMPFGVKFLTEGVLIVGFNDVKTSSGTVNPAKEAGLACNDRLLNVGNQALSGAADLSQIMERSEGKPLNVRYARGNHEYTTTLTPVWSEEEGRYSGGIYVRDSGAGIGTVTFILPGTGAFAGLGHGICDGETGKLVPIKRGSVVDVTISGVVKGLAGTPGEVRGYFSSGKTGTLLGNSDCGVWGVLASLPDRLAHETPIPVGLRDQVKEGKAHIRCTLDGNTCKEYEITISDIQRDATQGRCFTVKVTDEELLSKTGGIIQGMSGSPIIQNGKIIGAVTHVLINDPTTGYGIFIENMLNQMGDLAS